MRPTIRFRIASALTLASFVLSSCFAPLWCAAQESAQPEGEPAAESTPSPQESYEIICSQAETDAAVHHSGAGYGVGGFFCGVIGFAFAAMSTPTVPAERLAGKSSEYASTYTRCYRERAKKKNMKAACTGWGVGAAVSVAILLAVNSSSTN